MLVELLSSREDFAIRVSPYGQVSWFGGFWLESFENAPFCEEAACVGGYLEAGADLGWVC